jgi:hypothetical protein
MSGYSGILFTLIFLIIIPVASIAFTALSIYLTTFYFRSIIPLTIQLTFVSAILAYILIGYGIYPVLVSMGKYSLE